MEDANHVYDMIFVKFIERKLQRKLTTAELDCPTGIELRHADGSLEIVFVPLLRFPQDLMDSDKEDLFSSAPEVDYSDIQPDVEAEEITEDEQLDESDEGPSFYGQEAI